MPGYCTKRPFWSKSYTNFLEKHKSISKRAKFNNRRYRNTFGCLKDQTSKVENNENQKDG